jgi:hypothetical protein
MALNWQDIITTVGGQGAFLGVAAWLIKTLLNNKWAREFEAFKNRLQSESNIEIERLRSSLQITELEHQVRFSKLHEKRAQVIAELYKRLAVDVFWTAKRYVSIGGGSGEQGKREEFNKTLEMIREFALFVDGHRIYLPDNICALLDKLVDDLRKTIAPIGMWGTMPSPDEQTHKQYAAAVMSAFHRFEEDIPVAMKAIELQFRSILGEKSHEGAENAIV